MILRTTIKYHVQKDGTVWEWVEQPELRAYIAQQQTTKTKHEDLINDKNL